MQNPTPTWQEALAAFDAGHLPRAEALCRDILAATPDDFGAAHMLGVLAARAGQHDQALTWFDRAAVAAPDHLGLLLNRGGLLMQRGRHAEALESFDRAVAAHPSHPAALGNRGLALAALGRHEEALACFGQVIALRPAEADSWVNRGIAHMRLRRWQAALSDFDQALALRPDHARALHARIAPLMHLDRPSDALAACDQLVRARPEDPWLHSDRGAALAALRRPAEALEAYETALRFSLDHPYLLDHRGNTLRVLGRPLEALANHARAAQLAPDDPAIQWHLGMCQMLLGDFDQGLRNYEARWNSEPLIHVRRDFGKPVWLGDTDPHGKTILLHAEQGLGDTIQFCRYATLLAARGATVLLEVQPALRALLHGLDGVERVLVRGEPLPPFDLHCPLMSLPLAFRTTVGSIPAYDQYLAADPARVAYWSARLPRTGRPRIGLTWSGNPKQAKDRDRSMPLAALARLIGPAADFFGLQTEVRASDQPALMAQNGLDMLDPAQRDFADTAALITLMDLIISVDTSVAHLAGALGKPVWVLLALDPDWRWLLGRDDCPFYPSATLFRQTAPGDWDGVVDRVAVRLAEAVSRTTTGR